MKKVRIAGNVTQEVIAQADEKATALGISRSKLVAIALESELGHFNIHKENKRLLERSQAAEKETEAVRQQLEVSEKETQEARTQRDTFKARFEEAHTKYHACNAKLSDLLDRNWWERLWNVLPWMEK